MSLLIIITIIIITSIMSIITMCSTHRQTCSDCLHKSSPYCAWDLAAAACVPHAQVSS